jgi:hypothetical protein
LSDPFGRFWTEFADSGETFVIQQFRGIGTQMAKHAILQAFWAI